MPLYQQCLVIGATGTGAAGGGVSLSARTASPAGWQSGSGNADCGKDRRVFWKRKNRPPTTGAGSGRGGALGTPSRLPEEAPPSSDQEANAVVSGGGVVGPDEDGPHQAAKSSPSAQ